MSQLGGLAAPAAAEDFPASPAPPRRLGLGDLVSLFTRPRLFFTGLLRLGDARYLLPAVWVLGIAAQLDRIDVEILRYQAGQERAAWRLLEPLVTGSWAGFWGFCLAVAILSGAVYYLIGGWWYGLRVRWSGAKGFDKKRARAVYVWSGIVSAMPRVLVSVVHTAIYPSYYAAYNSDGLTAIPVLVLAFWAVAVSYLGVTSTFGIKGWKPRIWFLVLPTMVYSLVFGAAVMLPFVT